ncbi:uncharacterized protein FIBRA_03654 [Fibroporia radiculosa]|uniref:Ubiquinone biosynthesis monooxygenase COQ6, mitochondrial n=1 Tax=Fibroporia radiculosa TaxID=599839 RepID=J4H2I7_9APHY|nr:uncharacterized protein FIBRA_03654 [Fibroporia radiculosa]CCM01594.1 predicted protein [Fibroporia radiculosa]
MPISRCLKSKPFAFSLRHARQTSKRAFSATAYEDSDVVIVGGGPAGLALANALGAARPIAERLKVTLIEAGDLSKIRYWNPLSSAFSNRPTDTGAWSHVDESRTMPIGEMQVWDGLSDARITFSASDISVAGKDAPGEMARLTENLNLQRALLHSLANRPSIELVDKVRVQSIQQDEREHGGRWPLVYLSDGRAIRARLLVGADGFNSPVRSYAGIQSYGWAYDAQAIVATLNHHPRTMLEPPNTIAYQRFLPTGPIAFLPLSPTTSSLVWSTKPHLAKTLLEADPSTLATMVNAAFRLPNISLRYIYERFLDNHTSGVTLTPEDLYSEISFRERSHGVNPHSAYSSMTMRAVLGGVPPSDAGALPPFVTSIQQGTAASFPLRFSHADTYIGEGQGTRTVLVGDAAHTVHPLAGQGLNMGLGDVEALVNCIETAVIHGGDVGSHTALFPYARARYLENHKVMSAVDKLHKLYSSTAEPIVWARSVGVEVLNELDTIKAAIMMTAGSTRNHRQDSQGASRSVAVSGVENLAKGVSALGTMAEGFVDVVGVGVQGILRQLSSSSRR